MYKRSAAVAAAAILLAGVVPATAAAVTPRSGHYAQSRDNVIVATFDVGGGEIRSFSHNDSCAGFGVPVPAIEIRPNGRFSFTGAALENGIGQEYSVSIRGRAVSRTTIKGSMTYEKTAGNGPHCVTTTKFRAKRTGRARG